MVYYHIVDHDGFGTMHRLVISLCDKYKNHSIVDRDAFIEKIKKIEKENAIVVIHTSGGGNPKLLYEIENYTNIKFLIFIHTSYSYQKYKNRSELLKCLQMYSTLNNVRILVPSNEVAKQYRANNIKCMSVQLGIRKIKKDELIYKNELSKYYDKIITTCTSSKDVYLYLKGIDLFQSFGKKYNIESNLLILGRENVKGKIESIKLSEEDFINVLYHSKMYLQFSRMESYNLTAVQAKQLRVPVVLLRAEGNYDCMKGHTYETIEDTEQAAIDILNNGSSKLLIERLYKDSVKRESLKSFRESLEEVTYENTKKST